jgi:hypothetical protein
MSDLNILQNFKPSDVKTDPFVYFSISNTLPEKYYAELESSYPTLETFYAKSHRGKETAVVQNTFYKLHASKVLDDKSLVSHIWRDFVEFHTSQTFLDDLLNKVGDKIGATHPHLVKAMASKTNGQKARSGVRNVSDKKSGCELALDCMIGINSPVTETGSRVIGAHLDNPKMLYASLLYFRHKDDTSKGGDFTIYEWKDRSKPVFVNRRQIPDDHLRLRDSIPYARNSLVWFLNSLDAAHGVTVRDPTPHPRRLCEVLADAEPTLPKLFSLGEEKDRNWLKKLSHLFKRP